MFERMDYCAWRESALNEVVKRSSCIKAQSESEQTGKDDWSSVNTIDDLCPKQHIIPYPII